jgi:prolycopene isomerase
MGGLTAAAKLVEKGAKVVVLEKYLLPGGSAAHYKRQGYTFDVGSSMMFGFGSEGTTNLITKALESVGKKMATVPDPTQVHYHLPASKAHPDVSRHTGAVGTQGRMRVMLRQLQHSSCNSTLHQ